MGGKSNEKWQICRFLNQIRQPGQLYIEPFVGACNTFAMMDEPKLGIDIHPDLIAMWVAIQEGWEPPDSLSEEEYYQLKESDLVSPLRGFAGFACSYSGKWFGGYARRKNGYNFCATQKVVTLYKAETLKDSIFLNSDYKIISGMSGNLIYCDPPYRWTTSFKNSFNHEEFWDFVRVLSRENIVLTSEMSAPADFIPVLKVSRDRQHGMNSGSHEFLFMCS